MENRGELKIGNYKPPCLGRIKHGYGNFCSDRCRFCAYCVMVVMPEFLRQQAKEADK